MSRDPFHTRLQQHSERNSLILDSQLRFSLRVETTSLRIRDAWAAWSKYDPFGNTKMEMGLRRGDSDDSALAVPTVPDVG